MVLSSKNSAFISDVCRVFDPPELRPSPPKYRIGCSRRFSSGRLSRRGRIRAIKTLKESAYIYKTMSGRSGWPSRDPIGEQGGINLYGFVGNTPIDRADFDGRFTGNQCPVCGQWYQGSHNNCSGPPPPIDCSGYAALGGKTCKTCYGFGTKKDGYPENAHKVCEGFRDLYTGSNMQREAACVAKCLISAERSCQNLPTCSARNCCRLAAHAACYAKCVFFPTKGLPPGGAGVGAGDLIPSCASKGLF